MTYSEGVMQLAKDIDRALTQQKGGSATIEDIVAKAIAAERARHICVNKF